jgi:uncharacterized ferritin-like protein (DUF455 family)
MNQTKLCLRNQALNALQHKDPNAKCSATEALYFADDTIDFQPEIAEPSGLPMHPEKPALVHATQIERRTLATQTGHAALIHSLTHIEFNAVNLALDAIWRFPNLPPEYYAQWLSVAKDEARHFRLLQVHLQSLGFAYGDFPAHDGLWDMAEKTKHDVLARMALVPRTLEARGLDASPKVRDKLFSSGDKTGAAIVSIILNDEIGHVHIGNYWYRWLCAQRRLEPLQTYRELAAQYEAPALRPPFNLGARRQAGFTEEELAMLTNHHSVSANLPVL